MLERWMASLVTFAFYFPLTHLAHAEDNLSAAEREIKPTKATIEGGGIAVQGVDATGTGTSGGGFQATWIGALDTRIGAVLPSCFPTAPGRCTCSRSGAGRARHRSTSSSTASGSSRSARQRS